ncbi:MAG: DUF4097 family beta strand repeat protein [Acidobacteria bacterium]|nr:DUF4097 family beta strand repeat protein [Acidobacteriota bacterium]MBI3423526.1 DUF4097 family beta strand repeat protein [Acidobacteriota bacterium]
MRKLIGFGMLLVALCGARVVNGHLGQQAREFNQTAALEPGGTLVFETDKGSVKLTAWERPEVAVFARIEAPENEDADYGRRAVEAARIDISGDARSLTIRSNFDNVPNKTEHFGGWSRSIPHIHYEIKAPRALNLRLKADRSRVSVQGFSGRLTLETDRTPVTARDLTGDLQIKVDRGNVQLDNVRGSLALNTDRTDTRANDLALERDSRLNVSRGEAELRLPASQGLAVSARNGRRETFETDFGITTQSFNKELIEGTINGGGPRLSVEGDRSKVYLRKK